MACNIVQGSEIQCRDAVGGVIEAYIAKYEDLLSVTSSSGVITAITMNVGKKFYTFQLEKENAQYDNNATTSVENGTTFWESTLVFTMKKMSASQKNSVKTLVQSRLVVIVKDANGIYWLMGETRGADVTTLTMTSGKAMGDLSGSTVTVTGKEPDFDKQVTSSLITALLIPAP